VLKIPWTTNPRRTSGSKFQESETASSPVAQSEFGVRLGVLHLGRFAEVFAVPHVGLQYCHGIGLSNWERPLMSRYHSFEHPVGLHEGMVFAIETYWPTPDGTAAARIEEDVVVIHDDCELHTRFPAAAGDRGTPDPGPRGRERRPSVRRWHPVLDRGRVAAAVGQRCRRRTPARTMN
jgi:hypothetical protein